MPVLGCPSVSDATILRLANALSAASLFYSYQADPTSSASRPSLFDVGLGNQEDDDDDDGKVYGTTADIDSHPKERFSRWCFDVLFLLVEKVEQSEFVDRISIDGKLIDLCIDVESRQRVAKLVFPLFMRRCTSILAAYLADEPLRGGMPFPRYAS